MSVVQKNIRPRLIPVPHNTRKPAAPPLSAAPISPTHIRLAGNGGVMVVGVGNGPLSAGPLTPYLPAGFASAVLHSTELHPTSLHITTRH